MTQGLTERSAALVMGGQAQSLFSGSSQSLQRKENWDFNPRVPSRALKSREVVLAGDGGVVFPRPGWPASLLSPGSDPQRPRHRGCVPGTESSEAIAAQENTVAGRDCESITSSRLCLSEGCLFFPLGRV